MVMIKNKKLIYVSIFSLLWALSIFFSKLAINSGVEAFPFTIQVTITSVVVLFFYNLIFRKKYLLKTESKHFKILIAIGLIVGIAYISGFYGLKLSTAINYGFLIKSTLVFTILLAYIFLEEKLNPAKLALLATFIIGVYFLSTAGKIIIPGIGDLLIIFTAFCYSLALVITKPLTKNIHSDVLSLARVGFALVVLLTTAVLWQINFFQVLSLPYVIIIGIIGAIEIIFLNKTIQVASASYLTMMSMMVPVITFFLGVIFLQESLNLIQLLGAFLIIASGILVEKLKI